MQMTPDEYADYIADGSKYSKHGVRWQFLRDRAKGVIDLFRPKKVTKEELENIAKVFHDGELGAEEWHFDAPENAEQRKWCIAAVKEVLEAAGLELES